MEIVYLLVVLASMLAVLIAWGLLWAIRSGQFDDLDRPAHEVLWDRASSRVDVIADEAVNDRAGDAKRS